MIQLGERLGFAREASGECGIMADAGRKNFERDKAIQFLLPRLVNRAHAAFADEFQDFELREQRRQFGDGRRLERRRLRRPWRSRRPRPVSAGRRGKVRRARRRAAGCRIADISGCQTGSLWCHSYTHLRSKSRKMLPELKLENAQHRTSNSQHPNGAFSASRWMFSVQCWMLDVLPQSPQPKPALKHHFRHRHD